MRFSDIKLGMEFYDEMNDCKVVIDEIRTDSKTFACDVYDDFLYNNSEDLTPHFELHTLSELNRYQLMEY